MITPEIKDRILNMLFNHGLQGAYSISSLTKELCIDRIEHDIMSKQFESLGIIERIGASDTVNYRFTADGVDFVMHGGFTAKEKLLEVAFEKLNLELEALRETAPKRAEVITGLMANITSIMNTICAVFARN